MSVDRVVYTFNKFYYDFLKDLKGTLSRKDEIYTQIKEQYKVRDNETTEHIDLVTATLTDEIFEQVYKPDSTLADFSEVVVIKGKTIGSIKIDASLTSYIYTFALFVNLHKTPDLCDKLFELVMKALKAIQSNESIDSIVVDIMDDDVTALLANIKRVYKVASSGNDAINKLENTKIGNIAKEIAEDMKLDGLDLQRPEDILKGNGDLIGKIVSSVSSKLQKKFEDGTIKHDELLSEAMSVIGGMGGGQDNFLANMMKSFGGMAGAGGGGGSDAKRRSSSVAKKLRRKLEDKK